MVLFVGFLWLKFSQNNNLFSTMQQELPTILTTLISLISIWHLLDAPLRQCTLPSCTTHLTPDIDLKFSNHCSQFSTSFGLVLVTVCSEYGKRPTSCSIHRLQTISSPLHKSSSGSRSLTPKTIKRLIRAQVDLAFNDHRGGHDSFIEIMVTEDFPVLARSEDG